MSFDRPLPEEIVTGIADYVARVPAEGSLVELLAAQGAEFVTELRRLPAEKHAHRYAEGKWTVAELIIHISDSERIFAYRALRIGRGDTTPLPGFEQDPYVEASRELERPWPEIVEEFETLRRSTVLMLKGFSPQAWLRRGPASTYHPSVRAIVAAIYGHLDHHRAILRERYLA